MTPDPERPRPPEGALGVAVQRHLGRMQWKAHAYHRELEEVNCERRIFTARCSRCSEARAVMPRRTPISWCEYPSIILSTITVRRLSGNESTAAESASVSSSESAACGCGSSG